MAVLRQFNWLGQMRVDVPFQRMVESAVAADFDVLAGQAMSGKQALVLQGLTISTSGTLGSDVETLQLNVAGALIFHYLASENGTVFTIADDAASEVLSASNSKVVGAFTANTTNYVGLNLIRVAAPSTSDSVQFLDANTDTEFSQTVPLGRLMEYEIIISTQNFTSSPSVLPIAKIVTSSTNTVVSIQDCRQLMFRLGSGGDNPQAQYVYPWSSRTENPITYSGGADPFIGADKSITNFKSWMDAVMTSIWEIRGGEYWFSSTTPWNIEVAYGPVSTLADNWVFDTAGNPDLLKWESISVAFENSLESGIYYNTIANNTTGVSFNTDGLCLYVDLVRESNATNIPAYVVPMEELGESIIPGRRMILAWRVNGQVYVRGRSYEVGRALQVATTSVLGVVKLSRAATTPAAPIVIADTGGTITAPAATAGLTITAGAGNVSGLIATGGAGAATGGTGVVGTGGSPTSGNNQGGRGGTFAAGTPSGSGVGNFALFVSGVGATTSNNLTSTNVPAAIFIAPGRTGFDLADASVNQKHGLISVGDSSHSGVRGIGGASGGSGVEGVGGTNGYGFFGRGQGNAAGVIGIGDLTRAAPALTNGHGVVGMGATSTSAPGGYFIGGSSNGRGILVQGDGSAVAGHFQSTGGTSQNVISADGYISLNGATNPSSSTAFTKVLTPSNFPKAWARIHVTAGPTVTIIDGFNVTSASITDAGATLTVTLASAMTNANYIVMANPFPYAGSPGGIAIPYSSSAEQTTTTFKLRGIAINTTPTVTNFDFNILDTRILVVVYGNQ